MHVKWQRNEIKECKQTAKRVGGIHTNDDGGEVVRVNLIAHALRELASSVGNVTVSKQTVDANQTTLILKCVSNIIFLPQNGINILSLKFLVSLGS